MYKYRVQQISINIYGKILNTQIKSPKPVTKGVHISLPDLHVCDWLTAGPKNSLTTGW